MTDHLTVSWTIGAPFIPAAVDTHALAMAREKALSKTTDRAIILAAVPAGIEGWCSRLFFRGGAAGADRASACPWSQCATRRGP